MKFLPAAVGSLAFLALGIAGCAHKAEVMPEPTPTPETATATPTPTPEDTPEATPQPQATVGASGGAMLHYVVQKGDNLWAISAKSDVLGNSMLWPILYKSNRDAIADPDLIEAGQQLDYVATSDAQETTWALSEAGRTPAYVSHTEVRKNLDMNY
jgi:nucleoid-associated protein YgaU